MTQTAEGTAVTTQVMSKGTVSEVDMSGSEPQLIVGPMQVPLSKISTGLIYRAFLSNGQLQYPLARFLRHESLLVS